MKTTVFHKAGKRAISLAFALAVGVTAIYVAIPRAPAHAAPIGANDYLYSISFSTADIFKHKDSEGQTHAGLYYSLDVGAFQPVPGSEYYNNEIPQYTDFDVFDVYLSEDGLDYYPESSGQWTQIAEPLTGETFFALETAVSFQVNSAPTLSEVTVNPTDGHKVVKASFKSTSNSLFAFVSLGACGDYVLGYSFRVNGIPGSLLDGSGSGGGYTEADLQNRYNEGVQAGRTEGYDNGYNAGYATGKKDGADETYDSAFAQGQSQGRTEGYTEGHTEGYQEGKTDGYTEGHTEGYQEGQANALTQFISNGATKYNGKLKATKSLPAKASGSNVWRYVQIQKKITDLSFTLVKYVEDYILNEWVFPSVVTGQTNTLGMAFECFAIGTTFDSLSSLYTLPATGEITTFEQFQLDDLLGGVHTYFKPKGSTATYSEVFMTNSDIVGKTFYVIYSATLGGPSSVPGEETPFKYYYAYAPITITSDMVTEIDAPFAYAPSGDPFSDMYNNGYWAGYDAADAPAKMAGFLPGIFGGVTKFFAETLGGMTVFGISALDVFLTFIMIGLVSFVIRFVK